MTWIMVLLWGNVMFGASTVAVYASKDFCDTALAGATVRDTGDGGKLWARRDTTVDISPLVAVTLAAWAHGKFGRAYDLMKSVAPPT